MIYGTSEDVDIPKSVPVVIVGSGPAGVAAAERLHSSGINSIVLEAGPQSIGEADADPYQGENTGMSYSIEGTRARALGGTSNLWNGWCRPLDPSDFRSRPWISKFGWPIQYEDLQPYYESAAMFLGLSSKSFQSPIDHEMSTYLSAPVWEFAPQPLNVAQRKRSFLLRHDTKFVFDAMVDGFSIENGVLNSVRVSTKSGRRVAIKADHVILATGGLETVRLLLWVSHLLKKDRFDLDKSGTLGSGWMEHPHLYPFGYFATLDSISSSFLGGLDRLKSSEGIETQVGLAINARAQEEFQLPSMSITFEGLESSMIFGALPHAKSIADLVSTLGKGGVELRFVTLRAESRPTRSSFISLSRNVDPFGIPRLRLNWDVLNLDLGDYVRGIQLIASVVSGHGLGVFWQNPDWAQNPMNFKASLVGGHHHLGGARMASSPEHGVVNEFGQLFSLENLWVASSATFPQGGFSNPTMTVVALAQRIADRISTL